MTNNGMLDAYLICQALGWEWNFQNMIILGFAPILIIGAIIFLVFFVIPFLCVLIDDWRH